MPQNVPPQLRELVDQYPASFALLQTIPCLHTSDIPFEFFERGIEDLPAVLTEKIERDPPLNSVEALLAPLVLRDLVKVDFERNTFTPLAKLNLPEELLQHFAEEVATRLCARWANEGWQAAGRRNARQSLTLLIREGEGGGSMFGFFRKPFVDGVEIEEINEVWGLATAFAKFSFEAYDLSALARRLRAVAATLDQETCPQQYAWLIEKANWISDSESVDENPMQEVYELVFSARNFFEEGDYGKAADYYWQAATKARKASPEDESYAVFLQASAALAAGSGQDKEAARHILNDVTQYCLHPESVDDPYLDLIVGTAIEVAHVLREPDTGQALAQLADRVKTIGSASHEKADALSAVLSKCIATNDWNASERYAVRILDAYIELDGPISVKAITSRYNLALIYRYSGQIDRAIEQFEKVFSAARQLWENEPEKVVDLAMRIAAEFGEIQNHRAAKPYLLYAVKAIEARRGVQDDYVALSSLAMSQALWLAEDFHGVAQFLPIAVRGLEARQGRGDYQTLDESHRLVSTYERINDTQSAHAALDRLFASLTEAADPEDARIGSFMVAVAQTFERLGEVDKALALVNLALPIEEMHFGPTSYEAGIAKLFLFRLYGKKGEHERAERFLGEARFILRDDMPADFSEELQELQDMMRFVRMADEEDALTPAQKKLELLPRDRSSRFTGRERELAAITEALNDTGRVALTGPDGFGKTEIAIEFASRSVDRFNRILWIDARDEWTLSSGLRYAFQDLDDEPIFDDRVIFARGSRYLSKGNYLLVCDNVEDPERLARYLPDQTSGQIVFISRSSDLAPLRIESRIDLGPWTPEESAQFLANRLDTVATEEGLAELCAKLDHCPISLEIAAAYLIWTGASFGEYTHLLEGLSSGENEVTAFAAACVLNLSLIRQRFPAAWDLICVASQMAPSPLPTHTIVNGAEAFEGELSAHFGDFPREAELIDLVKPLQELSLAFHSAGRSTFEIHPLVRTAVENELTEEERNSKRAQAAQVLDLAYASPFNSTDHYNQQLDHTWFVGRSGSNIVETRLLHTCANFLGGFKRVEEALILYDRVIAGMEKTLGEWHVDLVPVLADAGNMLMYAYEFPKAFPYYDRMYAIQTQAPETDLSRMRDIVRNLGFIYPKLGLYKLGRAYLDQQAELTEKLGGRDTSDMSDYYFEVGEILDHQEAVTEAKWFYERALAIRIRFLGEEHAYTQFLRRRLTWFARRHGDFDAARELSRRMVEVSGPVPGADAIGNGTDLVVGGSVRAGLGELEESIAYFTRAIKLETGEGKGGKEQAFVNATTHSLLAITYQELNRPDSMREHLEITIAYLREVFPAFHPLIIRAMTDLGWALEALGETSEAAKRREEAKHLKALFDVRNL